MNDKDREEMDKAFNASYPDKYTAWDEGIQRGFTDGWQAALSHRDKQLPTGAEIASIITSMRHEYAADACVPIEQQGHEIADRILARLQGGK